MQPSLGLVYNSGAADTLLDQQAGIVGHGFELAGLGWIQVDPNDSDTFYLNLNGVSERLIHLYGTSFYYTEHETFWQIELRNDGENGLDGDWASLYWLVTVQDGTQYRFGYYPDSTSNYGTLNTQYGQPGPTVYQFNLDQVQDVYGNTYSISYEEESLFSHNTNGNTNNIWETSASPIEIVYTTNDSSGLNTTRRVNFVYGQPGLTNGLGYRADYVTFNLQNNPGPGGVYAFRKALLSINMSVDKDGDVFFESLVRRYKFEYTYYTQDGEPDIFFGPEHYHLMLTGITEQGADQTPLPTTVLTYTNAGHLSSLANGYGAVISYTYELIETGAPEMYWYAQSSASGCQWIIYGGICHKGADDPDTDRWRVTEKTILDDGAEVATYRYVYGQALFRDKDFRGHQDVTVILPTQNRVMTAFSLGTYNTTSNIGQIYANERLWGKPYRTTIQNQYLATVSTVTTDYQFQSASIPVSIPAVLPHCVQTVLANSPAVKVCYEFDTYGNLIGVEQLGDVAITSDDRVTVMAYEPPSGERYVTNRLLTTTVMVDDIEVARTVYEYTIPNSTNQAVTQVKETQTELAYGDSVVRYTSFNQVGNPSAAWTDVNVDYTTITYDEIHQTFPVVTTYPEGLAESRQYDARFGVTTVLTDVNGLVVHYEYDSFGRVMTETNNIQGPVSYDYTPGATGAGLRVFVTNHGDSGILDDQYALYTYNGLGQLANTLVMVGDIIHTDYAYDGLGQLVMTTVPFTGTQPLRELNTTYDVLGRPLSVETLDGITHYSYPDGQTTIVTDALGDHSPPE